MAAQIGADFEQLLDNIHILVKSIEGAGVGTRATEIDALRTNTTATYLDSASAYTAETERMIGLLAADTAAFRDALSAVLEEKQQSEENLSSTLSQIAAIVDDPTLTPASQLQETSAPTATVDASDSTSEGDDSESGGY